MNKEYIEREAIIAFLENMAASRYLIQCFEDKERFPAADVIPVDALIEQLAKLEKRILGELQSCKGSIG